MKLIKCPQCQGKGEYMVESGYFNIHYPVKCTVCDGTGKVDKAASKVEKQKFKFREQARKERKWNLQKMKSR